MMSRLLAKDRLAAGILLSFFVFPASSNYRMDEFSVSSGGNDSSSSSNYQVNQIFGEMSDNIQESTNYQFGMGLEFVQMANTPPAPQWLNENDYYNKLKLIINEGGNPSDTFYAVAISSDDWATTEYVQSDFTVGPLLGSEDWQVFADWGGALGEFVVGLIDNTSYRVKVKAMQGDFTEGPWGPEAVIATSPVALAFDIDVSPIDQETSAPYAIDLGILSIGTVNEAVDKIWVDLETNGQGGAYVYIYSDAAGLFSLSKGSMIPSFTGDLGGVNKGYGVRAEQINQSSGGPMIAQVPYNGIGDSVGSVNTSVNAIFSSSSQPIIGGRGSAIIKAKVDALTPAASDYSSTLTIIASGTF